MSPIALAVLVVGLALTPAKGATAEDETATRSVSTSPQARKDAQTRAVSAGPKIRQTAPALTRAAVRRRLNEIAPADWLSRYGRVDAARRD